MLLSFQQNGKCKHTYSTLSFIRALNSLSIVQQTMLCSEIMDMNGAGHEQHDGPRELEIFSDEQVEEVMESLEYFKGKIEQLQTYCEQVNQRKMQVDEAMLEQKRKHHEELAKYQKEISLLRNTNIQLMASKVASPEKRGNFSVSALSCAIDAETAEARIQDVTSKLRSVELNLAERDKHISVMEWQIMDLEATIATLQAERDQMILDIELRHTHENTITPDPMGEVMGEERDFGDENSANAHRRQNPMEPMQNHRDLWGDGNESLSLRQMMSLSAEWTAKDGPGGNMRNPPQRHFSDCMKREVRVRSADLSRPNTTHSLEDFDNLSEVDSGLGLGKLTRTTNFCDILDADEYSNFHVPDNRLSFNTDLILEERGEEGGSPLQPLSKKWATFENGLGNGSSLEGEILGSEEKMQNSENFEMPDIEGGFPHHPPGENGSLGSSTSDFSSAFHSSQDILHSSADEPWVASREVVSESSPPTNGEKKKILSRKQISKSDSCILSSRAKSPPSDKEDMWNFTPDSVVNVSTGEILIPSLVETPPSPSLKKSRSFTSSIEIFLKGQQSPVPSRHSPSGEDSSSKDNIEQIEDIVDKSEEGPQATPEEPHTCENVVLRNKPGRRLSPRGKFHGKSKSACEESTSGKNKEDVDNKHKKSLSDPIKKSDEKRGRKKLMEYQKWQKYGRRGKPPADLKISE
ncbi:uncharacterized protein LOC114528492 isoform X2 [Dendronephthya gigantea]|uniref:uncharacterized protein LOC114528492 isoform X2 n=1 Tax=Dendronephthya gigantea TaxID=151771 RepID=UPI00106C08EC|nr:uncharacterized protein LOC114528492 isoform X2 [Dendronephthya gigantea]